MYKKNAFDTIKPIKIAFYVRCMEKFGFTPAEVLSGTNLTKEKLKDRFLNIEVSDYIIVVSNMLRLTDCEHLPFLLGEELTPGDLGVLGSAVAASRNTIEAVKLWKKYNSLFFGNLFYADEREYNGIHWYEYNPRVSLLPQLLQFFMEEKINIDWKVFREFNGSKIRCLHYCFSYPEPAHRQLYEKLLRSPVTFNMDRIKYTFEYNIEHFTAPFPRAEPETLKICEAYLADEMNVTNLNTTLSTKTRILIEESMPKIPTFEEIAENLCLSPRTYSRYLEKESTNYQAIVAEVRKKTAMNYLTTTTLSAGEIAQILGFLDTSSLRRAFKSWTGQTISEFRHNMYEDGPYLKTASNL